MQPQLERSETRLIYKKELLIMIGRFSEESLQKIATKKYIVKEKKKKGYQDRITRENISLDRLTNKLKPVTDANEVATEAPDKANSPR